jgi:HSP20 family protein
MLTRFDPFREIDRIAQVWDTNARGAGPWLSAAPIDAFRVGDEFVVQVDLPGVDPSSIDVTVERDVLTVSARRTSPMSERGKGEIQVVASERVHGTITRQVFLGDGLDTERISASYSEGVLTVTVPVADRAKPRRIEISTAPGERHEVVSGSTA